jgi:hypothetical protein
LLLDARNDARARALANEPAPAALLQEGHDFHDKCGFLVAGERCARLRRVTNVWILVGIGAFVGIAAFALIPRPGSFVVVGVCAALIGLGLANVRRQRRTGS